MKTGERDTQESGYVAFLLNLVRFSYVYLQKNQEHQEVKFPGYSREEIFSSNKKGNMMLYRLLWAVIMK